MTGLSRVIESNGHPVRESAVLPELWITEFVSGDDGVPTGLAPCFLDREAHDLLPQHHATPHDFEEERHTKFGGLPYWGGNGVMSEVLEGATFLFQIASYLTLAEEVSKDYLTLDQGGGDAALLEIAVALDGLRHFSRLLLQYTADAVSVDRRPICASFGALEPIF